MKPQSLAMGVALTLAATGIPAPLGARADLPRPAATMPAYQPRTVGDAIKALAATRFLDRETASTYLMRQSVSALPQIEKQLAKEADDEAASRLLRVAIHLYMKNKTVFAGRAAMLGISLTLDETRPAVVVADTQPGFPAAEWLNVGDRIIGIGDDQFPSDYTIEEFRAKIAGQTPGEILRFIVVRGKEQLVVPVRLVGLPEAEDPATFVATRNAAIASYVYGLTISGHRRPYPSDSDIEMIEPK